MSPPCLATIFEGDNGGATTRGVSTTDIRIGIPVASGFNTSAGDKAWRNAVTAAFDHFNRHYEFYGRRLVPVPVEGSASSAATSRAQAADMAAQGIFGALTGWQEIWWVAQVGMAQELARNQVVTVVRNAGQGWTDRTLFDPFHPFVWSTFPSSETNLDHFADFSCRSLANRTASHAADPTLRSSNRRFAVVSLGWEAPPNATRLVDALDACTGIRPATLQWANTAGTAALRTGFERLRSAGVTTVICACEREAPFTQAIPEADAIGFRPEWVLGSGNVQGQELYPHLFWGGKNVAVMKLDPGPRLLPIQQQPWFGALLEMNPALLDAETVKQVFRIIPAIYENLLVMAAGIQSAGPALTPETFAAGLMRTQFPNPGAGQPPYWQPSARFGPGDHALYDDYTVGWWNSAATPLDPPVFGQYRGSWCYLAAGTRFRVGSYPPGRRQSTLRR